MMHLVCGVDEAGRGPLAGPVYAAAVILDPAADRGAGGFQKTVREEARAPGAVEIRAKALAFGIASASVEEIDKPSISCRPRCWRCAAPSNRLRRATDGSADRRQPLSSTAMPARAIIGGDATEPAISAASILAKTARDAEMRRIHLVFPQYALDRHKGYDTAAHRAALKLHGPAWFHRKSFAPVRALLEGSQ
jgi:ribonuclease HII